MMSRAKRLSGRLASAGLSTVALLAYACAPGDSGVPEPVDIIGFVPGEDFKLANYAPIAEYFETLAALAPQHEGELLKYRNPHPEERPEGSRLEGLHHKKLGGSKLYFSSLLAVFVQGYMN